MSLAGYILRSKELQNNVQGLGFGGFSPIILLSMAMMGLQVFCVIKQVAVLGLLRIVFGVCLLNVFCQIKKKAISWQYNRKGLKTRMQLRATGNLISQTVSLKTISHRKEQRLLWEMTASLESTVQRETETRYYVKTRMLSGLLEVQSYADSITSGIVTQLVKVIKYNKVSGNWKLRASPSGEALIQ